MNRNTLLSLLIFDLIVIVMTAGLLYYRYTIIIAPALPPIPAAQSLPAEPAKTPEAAAAAEEVAPQMLDAAPAEVPSRKLAFSYRNSKVKMVQIIGDFNDWIPAKMTKGPDHKWSVTLSVKPGEYAYNFVVDGRPIRDPNNPHICDAGRGFANSYLKVKPIDQE